jgi:hypothetical protein
MDVQKDTHLKKYPRFKKVQAGSSIRAVKWSVNCILDEGQPSNSMKMGLDMYIHTQYSDLHKAQ